MCGNGVVMVSEANCQPNPSWILITWGHSVMLSAVEAILRRLCIHDPLHAPLVPINPMLLDSGCLCRCVERFDNRTRRNSMVSKCFVEPENSGFVQERPHAEPMGALGDEYSECMPELLSGALTDPFGWFRPLCGWLIWMKSGPNNDCLSDAEPAS